MSPYRLEDYQCVVLLWIRLEALDSVRQRRIGVEEVRHGCGGRNVYNETFFSYSKWK